MEIGKLLQALIQIRESECVEIMHKRNRKKKQTALVYQKYCEKMTYVGKSENETFESGIRCAL